MSPNQSSNKYMSKLSGKRILVLGGTSGIGYAVAEASIESGAIVVISSSTKAKIDKAISKIQLTYPDSQTHIAGFTCDLFNTAKLETNLKELFDFASAGATEKIDHVVYTAGNMVGSINLADVDTETIHKNGILRFYAPIMIGKLAPRYLASSHESSITLTSGVNNAKPGPGRVLMAGWGAGVEGVTRGLAVDLKPIRVNCVCPGPVQTELFDAMPESTLNALVNKYRGATMTNTIGKPEDLAEAYLYCMRDHFVDGVVLHSSGGYMLA